MNEEKDQKSKNPPEKKKNPIISAAVVAIGLASAVWIFIPEPTDFIPLAGWIDEAAALAIVVSCFAYFGVDIKTILSKFGKQVPDGPKQAKGKVIDQNEEPKKGA